MSYKQCGHQFDMPGQVCHVALFYYRQHLKIQHCLFQDPWAQPTCWSTWLRSPSRRRTTSSTRPTGWGGSWPWRRRTASGLRRCWWRSSRTWSTSWITRIRRSWRGSLLDLFVNRQHSQGKKLDRFQKKKVYVKHSTKSIRDEPW